MLTIISFFNHRWAFFACPRHRQMEQCDIEIAPSTFKLNSPQFWVLVEDVAKQVHTIQPTRGSLLDVDMLYKCVVIVVCSALLFNSIPEIGRPIDHLVFNGKCARISTKKQMHVNQADQMRQIQSRCAHKQLFQPFSVVNIIIFEPFAPITNRKFNASFCFASNFVVIWN